MKYSYEEIDNTKHITRRGSGGGYCKVGEVLLMDFSNPILGTTTQVPVIVLKEYDDNFGPPTYDLGMGGSMGLITLSRVAVWRYAAKHPLHIDYAYLFESLKTSTPFHLDVHFYAGYEDQGGILYAKYCHL